MPVDPRVGLIFKGSFNNEHYDNDSINYMYYYLSMTHEGNVQENITEVFKFPVVNITEMDTVKEIKRSKTIDLRYQDYDRLKNNRSTLKLNLITNFDASLPVNFAYDPSPLDKDMGIIYATIVLLGLYVMIIWELVHRTFAAIIASTMSIGNYLGLHPQLTTQFKSIGLRRYFGRNERAPADDSYHVVDRYRDALASVWHDDSCRHLIRDWNFRLSCSLRLQGLFLLRLQTKFELITLFACRSPTEKFGLSSTVFVCSLRFYHRFWTM